MLSEVLSSIWVLYLDIGTPFSRTVDDNCRILVHWKSVLFVLLLLLQKNEQKLTPFSNSTTTPPVLRRSCAVRKVSSRRRRRLRSIVFPWKGNTLNVLRKNMYQNVWKHNIIYMWPYSSKFTRFNFNALIYEKIMLRKTCLKQQTKKR